MMPPEGPKKSEELLQRYTKERREQGGDFALHPATRRLLQGEVARQHGGAGRETAGTGWLRGWWLRLALGAATAVIVGVVMVQSGVLRSPSSQPMQMAKSEMRLERKDVSALGLVQDESIQAPLGKLDESERMTRRGGRISEKDKAAVTDSFSVNGSLQPVPGAAPNQPVPANAPAGNNFSYDGAGGGVGGGPADSKPVALGFAGGGEELKKRLVAPVASRAEILATQAGVTSDAALLAGAAFKAARADASRPPVASDRRLALGDEATTRFYRSRTSVAASAPQPDQTLLAKSDLGRVVQDQEANRFRRLDAEKGESFAKKKSSDLAPAPGGAAPLVLDGFVLEQSGSTIRLVDGDGSVYVGAVEVAAGANNAADFDADGLVRETRSKESELVADKAVALRSAVGRVPTSSSFRVSGTNRTSGQLVVVSGRLGGAAPTNSLAPTSGLVTGGATVGGAGFGGNAATNRVVEIDGTMRVGESAWQWFRAVRSLP